MRTDSVQHFSSLEASFNGLVQSSVKLVEMFQLKSVSTESGNASYLSYWPGEVHKYHPVEEGAKTAVQFMSFVESIKSSL